MVAVYKVKRDSLVSYGDIGKFDNENCDVYNSNIVNITRHGNKGVISKILPDYMMPHTETGEVVHIIFNTLGPYNRLNTSQLFEQSINFITNRIVERMKTLTRMADKEKLVYWKF